MTPVSRSSGIASARGALPRSASLRSGEGTVRIAAAPEQLLMALGAVRASARAGRDERQPVVAPAATAGDVRDEGLADERGHRPRVAAREPLQLPLEPLVEEDGRPLHMTYDSIRFPLRGFGVRGAGFEVWFAVRGSGSVLGSRFSVLA